MANKISTENAPGMKVKKLGNSDGVQHFVIIFSKGDEVLSGVARFAKEYDIKSASFQGIGAAQEAELAWYDLDLREYQGRNFFDMEITSLNGNISWYDGEVVPQFHGTVSGSDCSVFGGHVLKLIIGPTLELFVTAYPKSLLKSIDPDFNIPFINPDLD